MVSKVKSGYVKTKYNKYISDNFIKNINEF
jgi:hypothetical protein